MYLTNKVLDNDVSNLLEAANIISKMSQFLNHIV
jgi:hypothetical protein